MIECQQLPQRKSASQFLTKQFQVGVVGYVYSDRVGCFQSQVAGVGPQLGFIFPVGDLQGYLNLKYYSEFAAENRPHSWNTWVTFTISPPAPTPSTPPRRRVTNSATSRDGPFAVLDRKAARTAREAQGGARQPATWQP
jgi:hypothetical protein